MKFRTAYNPGKREPQTYSNKQAVWKKAVCEESGKDILVYNGYREVDKEIQEQAKGMGISDFIEVDKFGEVRAVRQANTDKAMYGDFTNVPETRAELVKSIKDAKALDKWIKEETLKLKGIEEAKAKAEKEANDPTKKVEEVEEKK